MKKFILLNSILLLLVSCNGGIEHHYIPDAQKPLLKNNDTIFFFDSTHNMVDTFRLDAWSRFNVSENLAYQYIDMSYDILKKRSSFHSFFTTQTENWIIISIDHNYDYYFEHNPAIVKNNFNIGGIVYPSVTMEYEKYFPDTIPCVVYYTYQDGILRYDYKDGRHYDRIKK